MGRRCVFCGDRADSKEDAVPHWLLQQHARLYGTGDVAHRWGALDDPELVRRGDLGWPGDAGSFCLQGLQQRVDEQPRERDDSHPRSNAIRAGDPTLRAAAAHFGVLGPQDGCGAAGGEQATRPPDAATSYRSAVSGARCSSTPASDSDSCLGRETSRTIGWARVLDAVLNVRGRPFRSTRHQRRASLLDRPSRRYGRIPYSRTHAPANECPALGQRNSLLQIWPSQAPVLAWPPHRGLNDEEFESLARTSLPQATVRRGGVWVRDAGVGISGQVR